MLLRFSLASSETDSKLTFKNKKGICNLQNNLSCTHSLKIVVNTKLSLLLKNVTIHLTKL